MRLLSLALVLAASAVHAGTDRLPLSTDAAVCRIATNDGGGGSGTEIGWSGDKKNALVISARHVCGPKGSLVRCYFENAKTPAPYYNGRVVRSGPGDFAAVLILNPGVPPVAIGDFEVHPGNYSACGYGATGRGGQRYRCANGPINGTGPDTLFMQCAIWPGFSGGTLFDPLGGFCGVTNACDGSGVNGRTIADAGNGLKSFIRSTTKQCGIFSRWRSKRGGAGNDAGSCPTCGPGGCPDQGGGAAPSFAQGGGGSGVPGYTDITPVQPPALQTAPATQITLQAQPQVVQASPVIVPAADPALSPYTAPVPDAKPTAPLVAVPAAAVQQPTQPQASPTVMDFASQLQAMSSARREQQAAGAALEAYDRALGVGGAPAAPPEPQQQLKLAEDVQAARIEAMLARLEKKLEATPAGDPVNPEQLVAAIPVVTMRVEYRDRTESAKLDLANYVRQTFGLSNAASAK